MHELYYPAIMCMSMLIFVFGTLTLTDILPGNKSKWLYVLSLVFSLIIGGLFVLVFSMISHLQILAVLADISGAATFTVWMIKIYKKSKSRKIYTVMTMFLLIVLSITILSRFDMYLPYIRLNPLHDGFGMGELRHFGLNVLLFVPFGVLLDLTGATEKKKFSPCFSGFLLSSCIELFQLLLMIGECDLMDVAGNGAGTLIGIVSARFILIPLLKARTGMTGIKSRIE